MGYRIRVLSTNEVMVPVGELVARVPQGQELEVVAGSGSAWSQLLLRHTAGPEIAVIERDSVTPGSVAEAEISEFISEVESEKPASAASWLVKFLPTVRVVYALQLLSGTDTGEGWSGVHAVRGHLWEKGGGILQADLEGFSNEDGHHILWQFGRDHDSRWAMAVLKDDGSWQAFEMTLNNPEHKRAFLDGRVPSGVRLL